MAEGAPLLREYVGKTCIEGSNPSGSAKNIPPLSIIHMRQGYANQDRARMGPCVNQRKGGASTRR